MNFVFREEHKDVDLSIKIVIRLEVKSFIVANSCFISNMNTTISNHPQKRTLLFY